MVRVRRKLGKKKVNFRTAWQLKREGSSRQAWMKFWRDTGSTFRLLRERPPGMIGKMLRHTAASIVLSEFGLFFSDLVIFIGHITTIG